MSGAGPYLHGPRSTATVMTRVALATLPGTLALIHFFGWGVLVNLTGAILWAAAAEVLAQGLRGRPAARALGDGSALVTALLLGLALPPLCPWWVTAVAAVSAILLGKQLFGGLGQNPFNPAMVGYVVVLVAFPLELTRWVLPGAQAPSMGLALDMMLGGDAARGGVDALTGPTLLDAFRHREGLTVEEFMARSPLAGDFAGAGWEWVNLGFLAGGLGLLALRLISWHAPVGMLLGLAIPAALFHDGGSSASAGSPLLHLFSGATMLGAFFIVTDPVSGATSPRGRLLFGAGVGMLVFVIRAWGGYPDAVAFAVLCMNLAVPLIDRVTRPLPYGHVGAGAPES